VTRRCVWNVVTVTMRQQLVPDDLLGRVNSAYRMLGWGLIPLGALAGGFVAQAAGCVPRSRSRGYCAGSRSWPYSRLCSRPRAGPAGQRNSHPHIMPVRHNRFT
jgi:hypothetical protein